MIHPWYPSISLWWQLWAQSCTSINNITVTGLLQPWLIIQWCVVNAAGKHTLFVRSQSPHSSLPLYQTCKRCLTRPKLFVFVNLSLEQRCRFWCCSSVTLSVGNVEYTGWQNDRMTQWHDETMTEWQGWQNDRKLHRQMTVWYIRTNTQRMQLLQLSLIHNWF